MKKFLLFFIFILLSSTIFSFGFNNLKGLIKTGSKSNLSKYDKVILKVEAIKLLQKWNETLINKSDKLISLIKTHKEYQDIKQRKTKSKTDKARLKKLKKEIKDSKKQLKSLDKELDKLNKKLNKNEVISGINPEEAREKYLEKKEELIDAQEETVAIKNNTVIEMQGNENILKEYRNDLKILSGQTILTLGLNAGVFFLAADVGKKIGKMSSTVVEDAKSNPIKGMKYIKTIVSGVKIVPKFINQSSETFKKLNEIRKFTSNILGGVNLEKEK